MLLPYVMHDPVPTDGWSVAYTSCADGRRSCTPVACRQTERQGPTSSASCWAVIVAWAAAGDEVLRCACYTERPRSELRLQMAGALARAPVPTVAAVAKPMHAVRANSSVAREAAVESSACNGNDGHAATAVVVQAARNIDRIRSKRRLQMAGALHTRPMRMAD